MNLIIVLLATILLTIIILGPTVDKVLKRSVEQEVRMESLQSKELLGRFKDPEELENYLNARIQERIKALGLNEPWHSPRRLMNIMLKILVLDFGQSYYIRSYGGSSNVRDIILEALPRTVLLFGTATVIVAIVGILLGALASWKSSSFLDRFISAYAVLSNSFPLWWVGMLMIFLFSYTFRLFPARATPLIPPTDPNYPLILLYHMSLPLLTLVLISFGGWAYIVRNLMVETLHEDYIMVAKAKGVPDKKIIYGHALKSTAPPIITIVALSLSSSLGGAIITEAVFDWPGLGRLYWEAISALDVPVIVGLTYITTLVFLMSMFIADMLYGFFDPRVRISE
ncbi:MAG: ABC transporter permease [Candidatus Bathyarchaeia archaeon]